MKKEAVMQVAGELPSVTEETATARQIARMVAQLPPEEQEKILAMIEGLINQYEKQKERNDEVARKQ